MAAPNHPVPIDGRFDTDDRVSFDKTAGKYQYEDDNGQEWEWVQNVWIPIVRIRIRISSMRSNRGGGSGMYGRHGRTLSSITMQTCACLDLAG